MFGAKLRYRNCNAPSFTTHLRNSSLAYSRKEMSESECRLGRYCSSIVVGRGGAVSGESVSQDQYMDQLILPTLLLRSGGAGDTNSPV